MTGFRHRNCPPNNYSNGSFICVNLENINFAYETKYDRPDCCAKMYLEISCSHVIYDMGDRRTEVNHPASGITSFTYDPLGNVLTKQTANMAEEG